MDPADLPASEPEGFGRRGDGEGALGHAGQGGDGDVSGAVEHQVLVDLVGDHQQVVLDGQTGHPGQFVSIKDLAGWVMRRVEEDHSGRGTDRRDQVLRIEGVVRCVEGDDPTPTSGQGDRRGVEVEVGLEGNDFLPGFDEG